MARDPKKAPLPEYFVESSDGKKAKCAICEPYQKRPDAAWIMRNNVKAHIQSVSHARCIQGWSIRDEQAASINEAANAAEEAMLEEELAFSNLQSHPIPSTSVNLNALHSRVQTIAEEAMWAEYDMDTGSEQLFHAGTPDDSDTHHLRLQKVADEFGIWNGELLGRELGANANEFKFDLGDQYDDIFSDMLPDLNPTGGDLDRSDILDGTEISSAQKTQPWYPYPSRTMFLLDTLDNIPRMRISDAQMKLFIWVLQESGARDVPSFYALCKLQKELKNSGGGVPTIPYTSPLGNVYFLNDPRMLISKDYSNPLVRQHLHFYPEIPDGPISEIWHADKWHHDLDTTTRSPMYDDGSRHYYLHELAQLKNGELVIPVRWVIYKQECCFDGFRVTVNNENIAVVHDNEVELFHTKDLLCNLLDLEDSGGMPIWHDSAAIHAARMPNPYRELAGGDPLYFSLIDFFGDDVSGNRSKSFNKHWTSYMTHRNLPRRLLQQEFHTKFISTSPHVSISEQFLGFKTIVE
ncbi:hypothetical protein BJ138DRAFT_1118659 [Hygrophoropsis aurantiaca]|uniref:Uncharacterized protein n=1 Tax=Hygrophoropsis aurantiaca TaxID=72124 RepID=A0ACB7ZWT0_9AGAM|nr:hypothetical protein BJ138DRAFT_1118659 [Hygrophoropsis aurantiaca]